MLDPEKIVTKWSVSTLEQQEDGVYLASVPMNAQQAKNAHSLARYAMIAALKEAQDQCTNEYDKSPAYEDPGDIGDEVIGKMIADLEGDGEEKG